MAYDEEDWDCNFCGNVGIFGWTTSCRLCGHRKYEEKDWNCQNCDYLVFGSRSQCPKCNVDPNDTSRGKKMTKRKGDWTCPSCGFLQIASKDKCYECNIRRAIVDEDNCVVRMCGLKLNLEKPNTHFTKKL